jgi:hypothetical protein
MTIHSFKLDHLFTLLVPELVVLVGISPSEPDFFQKSLSMQSNFVIVMIVPLRANPEPKRPVLFVTPWHHAMAILSFKLDQFFILSVPELVVLVDVVGGIFPSESDFVQESLSINSKFVIVMIVPLRANPERKRPVVLVTPWHHAMASLSLKLDQLFILLVPELVLDIVVGTFHFPSELDLVQKFHSIKSHFVVCMNYPLPLNPRR